MFTYLCKSLRPEDLETLMTTCLNDLKQPSMKAAGLTLDELRAYLNSYVWKIHNQVESNKQEGKQFFVLNRNKLNFFLIYEKF